MDGYVRRRLGKLESMTDINVVPPVGKITQADISVNSSGRALCRKQRFLNFKLF